MWWRRRWSGGLGSWVLSGFTPRASQTSHVQLWPIELRAGSPTLAQAQLECCGNAVVVCVCVCYVCLCGEALANRRPTVIQCGRPFCDPTHRHPPFHSHHTPPSPTSPARALWPCMSSRSTLRKKCTNDVRTHRHEHTHGFDQTGMHGPPVKRCDGNSK